MKYYTDFGYGIGLVYRIENGSCSMSRINDLTEWRPLKEELYSFEEKDELIITNKDNGKIAIIAISIKEEILTNFFGQTNLNAA